MIYNGFSGLIWVNCPLSTALIRRRSKRWIKMGLLGQMFRTFVGCPVMFVDLAGTNKKYISASVKVTLRLTCLRKCISYCYEHCLFIVTESGEGIVMKCISSRSVVGKKAIIAFWKLVLSPVLYSCEFWKHKEIEWSSNGLLECQLNRIENESLELRE